MTVNSLHMKPTTKQDCVDTWRARGRVPVPTKSGKILDMAIERLYQPSHVDGLALDLMIESRVIKSVHSNDSVSCSLIPGRGTT